MLHFTKKYESIELVKNNDSYSEVNPLPEIYYIGEINSYKNILFGKWETVEKVIENGVEIELFNEGIWQLKSY